MKEVNFVESRFDQSVFNETFSAIYSVAFSPDGQLLAVGSANGEVGVWQVARWKQIMTLSGHLGWVWSVTFSPDGARLASGGDDGNGEPWEGGSGQCPTTPQEATDLVPDVALIPAGARLAARGDART